MKEECFVKFEKEIEISELPDKFNFPFYYEPHPIALLAAKELQVYIENYTEWKNCFGLDANSGPTEVGKMFGVLVVQNEQEKLGFLRAFSGKIKDTNVWKGFVPPLFNTFEKGNRFEKVSKQLAILTKEYETVQSDPEYLEAKVELKLQVKTNEDKLKEEKNSLREAQKQRKEVRRTAEANQSIEEFEKLKASHNQESLNLKFKYKEYAIYLKQKLLPLQKSVEQFEEKITSAKNKRKELSTEIQNWIFDKYNFLNASGEYKNVLEIFKSTITEIPPSGAGDCAAPKLLQYAFLNNLKPIALAEFWWGKSPGSAIRKHGNYYPCCRGKCEPILGHMLEGMDVEENPMLTNPALGKNLEFVYEDEVMAIVNKPSEFLSVPGKSISDSVQTRMKKKFPHATGPLIVHRLDMSTSGLLLIAKNKETHKALQTQFVKRTIKKRYIAVLEGIIEKDTGYIDLPLRVDLDNRPCQMVCFEHGKSARTKYEVIERKNNQTRVYFYPITGRTHQLRMHAAHKNGLNAPIVGDDLYGTKAKRLHLHAEKITFVHPLTDEVVEIQVNVNF